MLDDNSKKRYIEKLSFTGCQLPDPLNEDVHKMVFNS